MNDIFKDYTDFNTAGAFSGATSFKKNNPKYSLKDIQKVLSNSETYTIHKPVVKKFSRSVTLVYHIDDQWQIDLVDVSNLKNKKISQFFNFLFVCIDVLSKYAWVIPIKNKEALNCAAAFKEILKKGRKPKQVYSDNGNEFRGEFAKLLQSEKISQIFTKSKFKASIVERFNRTLKQKMYRVFTFMKKTNYMQFLQKIVNTYNISYHRSIKMSPISVTKKNENIVFNNLYSNYLFRPIEFKFKKGSYVRIPVNKSLFQKGNTPSWSNEIYVITEIIPKNPPKYSIKATSDLKNIPKTFYEKELQIVKLEEFPYDTFEQIKSNKTHILVKKLNDENEKEIWLSKKAIETEQNKENFKTRRSSRIQNKK